MVDVRFELTTNDPWSVDDAIKFCEGISPLGYWQKVNQSPTQTKSYNTCPTRTGLAVGCLFVEIEGLSSRELFLISVLTSFNVKAQVPPRHSNVNKSSYIEKQTFFSRFPHSGGTTVSSAGFFFE